MPSSAEIRNQVELETEARARLTVPGFAGGFLYLLSSIVISSTLKELPTVGPLEGLTPAISGIARPAVSPRSGEVKFISHHAFPLIASSVLTAVAIIALTLILLLMYNAAAFRRSVWPQARVLVVAGGVSVALASVAHEIVYAIVTHQFAVGHNHTGPAVERALTKGTANEIIAYLSLLAGLALVVGMIMVLLNAMRAGLFPRWMGVLGMFSGLLILLPNVGAALQLVPAFWLVMMGLLCSGKWPNGDPPAWAAGEARPWPSRAQLQAERRGLAGKGVAAAATAGDIGPAPIEPLKASSRRRRKRGGRT